MGKELRGRALRAAPSYTKDAVYLYSVFLNSIQDLALDFSD